MKMELSYWKRATSSEPTGINLINCGALTTRSKSNFIDYNCVYPGEGSNFLTYSRFNLRLLLLFLIQSRINCLNINHPQPQNPNN